MATVSIILPSYNHAEFLKERLDSILNQTYQDWELIIIDDCSNDCSLYILQEFVKKNKQKVKHFIVNEKNSGSGYFSWRRGIELAESKYIWIAETDDYCQSNFLEETVNLLNSNTEAALAFVASNYVNVNGNFLYNSSNRTKRLQVVEEKFGVFENNIFIDILPLNTLITNGSSVLFRKQPIPIPVEIFSNRQMADLFLWRYLLENEKFIFLNKKLNYFRQHQFSTTSVAQSNSKEELYSEYVNFINYFSSSKETIFLIIKNYVLHFLFSNQNKNGLLYFKPLNRIGKLNSNYLKWLFIKAHFYRFSIKIKAGILKILK